MSLQLTVRFFENSPESEYESNLVSHCFELFESMSEKLDTKNFLAMPYTTNEEELYDLIEDELGGEPEDDGFDEFEEKIEEKLAIRGDFFPVSELLNYVMAYRSYFYSNMSETFDLGNNRNVKGELLVEDLGNLKEELERQPDGKARFTLN